MQRHDRIFGIIARDIQAQRGLSWAAAKAELRRELIFKNLSLCLTT
jgi:DNA-binding phage protein